MHQRYVQRALHCRPANGAVACHAAAATAERRPLPTSAPPSAAWLQFTLSWVQRLATRTHSDLDRRATCRSGRSAAPAGPCVSTQLQQASGVHRQDALQPAGAQGARCTVAPPPPGRPSSRRWSPGHRFAARKPCRCSTVPPLAVGRRRRPAAAARVAAAASPSCRPAPSLQARPKPEQHRS